jgi:N-methylhydantoinase B
MTPDDVLLSTNPAAGGWGDPLDRPVEDVQADLELEFVSTDTARTIYGVVLDGGGRVDPVATGVQRERIREERRAWPAQRQFSPSPSGRSGEGADERMRRVCPMGDRLEIVRDTAGQHWTRCACGHILAPAKENWRAYSGRNVATPSEVSPLVWVNEALEIRRYACPGCGRIHAVDLCRKGEPDPHDIRLVLDGS